MNFFQILQVHDPVGAELGTCKTTALKRWNEGLLPTAPGAHENLSIFPVAATLVDNGYGTRVPVSLRMDLFVKQRAM